MLVCMLFYFIEEEKLQGSTLAFIYTTLTIIQINMVLQLFQLLGGQPNGKSGSAEYSSIQPFKIHTSTNSNFNGMVHPVAIINFSPNVNSFRDPEEFFFSFHVGFKYC
jgi:hypothetical protein